MPKIRLMAEEDTDEPNGLEISFPVMDAGDFNRFQGEALHVLKPFKDKGVKFQVFGSRQTEVHDYNREVEGDGWFLSRDIRGGLIVRMGLVDYLVDTHQLRLGSTLRTIAQHGVLLRMPMGSVQPTPSRENLQIDDATRAALTDALDPVNKQLLQSFYDKLNAASSMQEARQIYKSLVLDYHAPYHEFQHNIVPMWRGRKVFMQMRPNDYGFEVIKITNQTRYGREKATTSVQEVSKIHFLNDNIDEITKKLVWADYPNAEYRIRTYLINFGLAGESLYMVRPVYANIQVPIKGKRKIERMRKRGALRGDQLTTTEVRNPTTKDMKRFFEALGVGWKAFRMASSFPKKERSKPQRKLTGPDPKAKAFTLKRNSVGAKADAWSEADLDIKAGGYYVPIRHWKCSLPCLVHEEGDARNKQMDPDALRDLVKSAEVILRREITVYGINKDAIIQRMEKEGNWKNVWDFLLEAFWEYQNDTSYKQYELCQFVIRASPMIRLLTSLTLNTCKVLDHLPWNHKGPIADAVLTWEDVREKAIVSRKYNEWEHNNTIPTLTRFVQSLVWSPRLEPLDLGNAMQRLGLPDLYEEYPLFRYMDLSRSYGSYERDKAFAEYIKQCDKLRSCKCE